MNYPHWLVTCTVASAAGLEQLSVEIDAPSAWDAEVDVTAMIEFDDIELLNVVGVEPIPTP
jgi:hypothetical protein